MTTRKLLWGMTWRGAVWGFKLGGKLGMIYGGILGIWIFITVWIPTWHTPTSLIEIYSFVEPFSLVGNIIFLGGLLGIIMGFSLGAGTGLLTGMSGYVYFTYCKNIKRYSQFTMLFAPSCVALGGWFLFDFFAGLHFAMRNDTGPTYQPTIADQILYIVIPTIIAVGCAIVACQRLARWYEHESAKGISQNVSPN